jgi:hypothetical protein
MKSKATALAIFVLLALFSGCGTPSYTPQKANGFGMASSPGATAQRMPFAGAGDSSAETRSSNVHTANPKATFRGCIYTEGKHHYQAVDISVGNPGEYAFNAVLYNGASCNPADVADQIGFGQDFDFGGFGWTFWFDHFPNWKNMSVLWYVGDDTSQCIDYETAPSC